MSFGPMPIINLRIDTLTRSVIDKHSGISHKTKILPVNEKYLVKNSNRLKLIFDWQLEVKVKTRNVFSLSLADDKTNVLGLISIEKMDDHIYVHLVERICGHHNIYLGIGGNLFAFAGKYAFEMGMRGHIAFRPKTRLINHFSVTLKAIVLLNGRMGILEDAARHLIKIYYPDETL